MPTFNLELRREHKIGTKVPRQFDTLPRGTVVGEITTDYPLSFLGGGLRGGQLREEVTAENVYAVVATRDLSVAPETPGAAKQIVAGTTVATLATEHSVNFIADGLFTELIGSQSVPETEQEQPPAADDLPPELEAGGAAPVAEADKPTTTKLKGKPKPGNTAQPKPAK